MTVAAASSSHLPSPAKPKLHLSYLDGIRACAALYIVFHHAIREVIWKLPSDPLPLATNRFGLLEANFFNFFGQEAVAIFITLSGFCLMLPIIRSADGATIKGGGWRFLEKRAKRILPPYYAAIALSLLLIATVIGTPTGTTWDLCLPPPPYHVVKIKVLLAHLLLIHELFDSTSRFINGPHWSVAAEWKIYLLFPLFVVCWKRFGALRTSLVAILVGITAHPVFSVLFNWFHIPIRVAPTAFVPEYVALFALGAAAASIAYSFRPTHAIVRERIPWAFLAASTALLLLLSMVSPSRHLQDWILTLVPALGEPLYRNVFVGISTASLLILLAEGRAPLLQRALSTKWLVFVGTISYSLYLIHYPLLQIEYQYVVHPLHLAQAAEAFSMLLLAPVIVLPISYIFYRLIERPSHLWAGRADARSAVDLAANGEAPAPAPVVVTG